MMLSFGAKQQKAPRVPAAPNKLIVRSPADEGHSKWLLQARALYKKRGRSAAWFQTSFDNRGRQSSNCEETCNRRLQAAPSEWAQGRLLFTAGWQREENDSK